MGLKEFFLRIEEEFEMVDLMKKTFFWKNHPLKVHGNLKWVWILYCKIQTKFFLPIHGTRAWAMNEDKRWGSVFHSMDQENKVIFLCLRHIISNLLSHIEIV